MIPYRYDRRVAGRLPLSRGEVDDKATASIRKLKLFAKNRGDFQSAVISAGFHAKKQGVTMYCYPGNSYGHGVWHVSYKAGDYLNPINNTGDRVVSVTPDLVVSWHETRTRPVESI